MDAFDVFQFEVGEWQAVTFPHSTVGTVLAHLKEEVGELCDDPGPEEAADVLMLLMAVATKLDFSLIEAVREKFEINKQRRWEITTAEGYTKHGAAGSGSGGTYESSS